MSDSTSIQNSMPIAASNKLSSDALLLNIVSLPKSLQMAHSQIQLTGQVVDINANDKTLSVKTESGKIVLSLPQAMSLKAAPKLMDFITLSFSQSKNAQHAEIRPAMPPVTTPRPMPVTNTINPNITQSPALTAQQLTAPSQTMSAYTTTATELKNLVRIPAMTTVTQLPHQLTGATGATSRTQMGNPTAAASPSYNSDAPVPQTAQNSKATQTALPYDAQISRTSRNQSTQGQSSPLPLQNFKVQHISAPPPDITRTETRAETSAPKNYAAATAQRMDGSVTAQNRNIPNTHAGQFHAKLIGFTKDLNLPVLQLEPQTSGAPERHVTLTQRIAHIPIGSQFALTPLPKGTESAPALQMPATQSMLPMAMTPQESWQIFNEITDALQNAPTAQALQNFIAMIPNPAQPTMLAPTMLFFFTAVRSGSVSEWLGDNTRQTLQALGKSELLAQLQSELGSGITHSRDPSQPAQEWRSVNLPMLWQEEIQKITLHYRNENADPHNENDADKAIKGKKTRFVMDLQLSHVGDVQLDGLFVGDTDKITQDTARMDLILRTGESFSASVQQHMRSLYNEALKQTNLSGELHFQQKADKWHNITAIPDAQFQDHV